MIKHVRHIAAIIALLVLLAGCSTATEPDQDAAPDATWKVVATSVSMKIQAIKATREVTGLGLKDAKELVDNVPTVIISGVSKDEAEAAASTLREAGMTAEVQQELETEAKSAPARSHPVRLLGQTHVPAIAGAANA